jgi:hypothetical protein
VYEVLGREITPRLLPMPKLSFGISVSLAAVVGNATERAYARSDALEQRRELMTAWAAYCERSPQTDNVIPIGDTNSRLRAG